MADQTRELCEMPNIDEMTHQQIVDELMHFERAVRMDFTAEFVAEQSLSQLQHILAAARMHISMRSSTELQPQTADHAD